jgi:hypothetical protein
MRLGVVRCTPNARTPEYSVRKAGHQASALPLDSALLLDNAPRASLARMEHQQNLGLVRPTAPGEGCRIVRQGWL